MNIDGQYQIRAVCYVCSCVTDIRASISAPIIEISGSASKPTGHMTTESISTGQYLIVGSEKCMLTQCTNNFGPLTLESISYSVHSRSVQIKLCVFDKSTSTHKNEIQYFSTRYIPPSISLNHQSVLLHVATPTYSVIRICCEEFHANT